MIKGDAPAPFLGAASTIVTFHLWSWPALMMGIILGGVLGEALYTAAVVVICWSRGRARRPTLARSMED